MWYEQAINTVLKTTDQLSMNQWLLVLMAVLIVGGMCLRGTGSRKHH